MIQLFNNIILRHLPQIQNNSFRLTPVGVEHLIALLIPQCFQILLSPRMFPAWDFVVGIFARKPRLNIGRVLSTSSC